jgi:hypothetical protein
MRFGQVRASSVWTWGVVPIIFGAIVLAFPSWLNGSPFLFDDSDGYFRSGKSIASQIYKSIDEFIPADESKPSSSPDPAKAKQADNYQITLISARSPFYGFLLYVSGTLAGLWGIVFIQALVASFVLWRASSALTLSPNLPAFLSILATAAVATSLPWFVNFAMPDVWLSFCVLLFGCMVFSLKPLSRSDGIVLASLAAMAVLFHNTNLPILLFAIVATTSIAAMLNLLGENVWKGCLSVTVGIVIASATLWAFKVTAERHFHERLRMPIFITARLLADGPGRQYLRQSCAEDKSRYALCKYESLPLDNSEEILWSVDPARGVYTVADVPTRFALSDEQLSFALSTFFSDPLGVAGAASKNALKQLTKFGLSEFSTNYWKRWAGSEYWSTLAIFGIVGRAANCLKNPNTCAPTSAVHVFDTVAKLALLFSSAFLLWKIFWYLSGRGAPAAVNRNVVALSLFSLIIVFLNAVVCGALSGPNDRYQARLVWIIPVLSCLIATSTAPFRLQFFQQRFARFTKP